jgi:TolB-like protein/Flp pilus assembly protein TadD
MTAEGSGSLPVIGQTVSHYRVLAKLASGGMGEVYKAEDVRRGQPVALKFLSEEVARDRPAIERFTGEARAASALKHPNICTIHDIGEHKGRLFIAMELLGGLTLKEQIAGQPLPTEQVVELGLQLADALDAAHAEGIIHRGIEPSNILVTERDQAKILDFGLTNLVPERRQVNATATTAAPGHSTGPGTPVGAAAYQSPEQIYGRPVDACSDLFSLGVVLYEMATGRLPFTGITTAATFDAILHRAPITPREWNPDVPPKLQEILNKLLEKDRELRYQSAAELRAHLSQLKREMGSERPTSMAVRRETRPTRRWVLALLGVLALLVVMALGLTLGGVKKRLFGAASGSPIKSLAVLPLENLAGDPKEEYLADGMTEALITDLAKIRALRVISRTSVMQYKGTEEPLPEIARQLGVDAVVEGSVLRVGDRVRITAQLIEAETDQHLWGDSYERDLSDVLGLQNEVALAIAERIKIEVTPQEQARLTRTRTVNPEAHEAYLRGRYHWNKKTEPGFQRAIEFFQQAVDIDPVYAPAYAGLADCYNMLAAESILPPQAAYSRARAAAVKALEIDETLGEAHTSLASIRENHDWDWAGAEAEYRRAIKLTPRYATAHEWYASFLRNMGRMDEAMAEIKRAQELDPLSLPISATFGGILIYARLYDEAIDQHQKAAELYPSHAPAHHVLGKAYLQAGRYEEAVAEFQRARKLLGDKPETLAGLGHTYAVMGKKAEARQILGRLTEMSTRGYAPSFYIALLHGALGQKDQAFAWLEKAYDARHPNLAWLKMDPWADPLRLDPRFQDLLRRMNFPE